MAATRATRRAAMVAIAEGYSPEDAGCQLVAGWGWPSTSTRSNSVQAQFGQLNLANIGSFEASWVVGHVTRLSTYPPCPHVCATATACLPSRESNGATIRPQRGRRRPLPAVPCYSRLAR